MGEERRTTARIRTYRPLRLQRSRAPGIVETLTKDLAPGGLRCLSSTLVPVASEVDVELVLSRGEEPLTVKGRAVWFQTIPESEQFDIGIQFLDLDPQSKRRLSVYIDRFSSQTASVSV
jgi:hypothetical protein